MLIIMNKKCQQYILRTLYVALLLVGCVTAFSACSNNDEILIDYYLHINSQEDISISSTDQEQGTMSAGSNVLARTIEDLRVAIRENYPVPTTQGDDSKVGAACDDIYYSYKAQFGQLEKNTICVATLYRVNRIDGIIRSSTCLRVYHFGYIPPVF
jgi:hypothetical protein